MPTPRHDLQAITVDSKIYAVSGAGDETVHAVEIYDPQGDSWESGPPIPTARGWFGAGLANGAIYAIGGKRVRPTRRSGEPGTTATSRSATASSGSIWPPEPGLRSNP